MAEQTEWYGFRPPEEYDTGVNYKSLIVAHVEKKGCSYPAEMIREIGMSKDTLYIYLYKLIEEGKLEKHSLAGKTKVPSWLKPRIRELWGMNIKGDRIKGMAWYTLADVEDTSASDRIKENKTYDKRTAIIDYWMNVHRGVEPSEEQKEASEDGKLTTNGDKIIPVEEQKEEVKKGED